MTRQVAEAICLEHDTRADGTLDYAALCDDIFPGDFDHYAHQQHFVYKVGCGRRPLVWSFFGKLIWCCVEAMGSVVQCCCCNVVMFCFVMVLVLLVPRSLLSTSKTCKVLSFLCRVYEATLPKLASPHDNMSKYPENISSKSTVLQVPPPAFPMAHAPYFFFHSLIHPTQHTTP